MKLIPDVVKNLMIINGLFFLGTYVATSFGISLVQLLGLYYPESPQFQPYQVVTHIFMHGGFLHIFSNMFMLWMFGSRLEQFWGPKRFLFYYFFTGFGAALLHTIITGVEINMLVNAVNEYVSDPSYAAFREFSSQNAAGYYTRQIHNFLNAWSTDPDNPVYLKESVQLAQEVANIRMNIPTVGASGAVFGILLAFGMLFPNSVLLIPILFFMPVKAKYFVIFYGLFELYAGFTSLSCGSNIAHFAHLGGMLFGFILLKYWQSKRTDFY